MAAITPGGGYIPDRNNLGQTGGIQHTPADTGASINTNDAVGSSQVTEGPSYGRMSMGTAGTGETTAVSAAPQSPVHEMATHAAGPNNLSALRELLAVSDAPLASAGRFGPSHVTVGAYASI